MISKKRLISTFIQLVKIDSPSGEEKKIAKFVSGELKKLDAKTEFDNYGNIIAKLDGIGNPIMLNAHLDTVEPGRGVKPKVIGNKIVSNNTTILGADAKSGIAIILETLVSLKEDKKLHLPIELVFTVEEEAGLFGAVNLDYKKLKAKYGVTFDGVGKIENITTAAPGYTKIDAKVIGRGAHSGYEPEKGLSAIKIASEIILNLKEGRIDHETTANIGIIEGGSARNAVPEFAYIKAEIRSRSHAKLDKHTHHFEEVFVEVSKLPKDALIEIEAVAEVSE